MAFVYGAVAIATGVLAPNRPRRAPNVNCVPRSPDRITQYINPRTIRVQHKCQVPQVSPRWIFYWSIPNTRSSELYHFQLVANFV